MRVVVIYILEVIACSGVLAALYSLIIELFLIFSVLLSAVIPMINIPVWEAALVPQLTEVTVGEVSTEVVQGTVTSFDFNFVALIWAVYGVGVALCMGSIV